MTEDGEIQYHFPRTNPPNAMSPMSATMRPIQKLHTNIRTIPTMTMIPPAEIPADPRRPFGDPAMRSPFNVGCRAAVCPPPIHCKRAQQALFRSLGVSLHGPDELAE